jgi:ATP-dependent Zn protease
MILLAGQRPATSVLSLSAAAAHCPKPIAIVVAHHEAGHACVGTMHGVKVSHASILGDAEMYGAVWFQLESWDAAPMEAQLVAHLSGQAAQDHVAHRHPISLPSLRFDGTDVPKARSILARHLNTTDWHSEAVEAELNKWREYVGHSVYHLQSWIHRVAAALLAQKCLTGMEIERLRR